MLVSFFFCKHEIVLSCFSVKLVTQPCNIVHSSFFTEPLTELLIFEEGRVSKTRTDDMGPVHSLNY